MKRKQITIGIVLLKARNDYRNALIGQVGMGAATPGELRKLFKDRPEYRDFLDALVALRWIGRGAVWNTVLR